MFLAPSSSRAVDPYLQTLLLRVSLSSLGGKHRQLERGIPWRESTELSDPIERVRALPSEPLQVHHERVSGPRADPYRMGHGRSLELLANSSPKHP